MKNTLLAVLAILIISPVATTNHCLAAADVKAAADSLKVVAVETFLADVAQQVAGDRLKITALMPIGADPHSFEPTPVDVKKVADCSVLIVNGAGFEAFLDKLLENAGGTHKVIEASAGLTNRTMREGELAEMSDTDLADGMCGAIRKESGQALLSATEAGSAVAVPGENKLFEVLLTKQASGTHGGFMKFSADETGDFVVACGKGGLKISEAANSSPLEMERTFPLNCRGLAQGGIVEFEKGAEYLIVLSGFTAEKTSLLLGPQGGHHQHEGDPHFWLVPGNMITYVQNIRKGLSEADPGGAKIYATNADAYIARLNELDRWIADQVALIPASRRLLVTNHESLGYFADRYGFKIIGTIVPSVSTGSSPSARQLAGLADRIKATGAKAIFLETGTNPQLARQLAEETGIKVVTDLHTHSISTPSGPAPGYIEMMKYNTSAIVNVLK
jgi:manganese/iron transport system substrate-binding protein